MATTYSTLQPNPTDRFTSKLRDYYILTKPEPCAWNDGGRFLL